MGSVVSPSQTIKKLFTVTLGLLTLISYFPAAVFADAGQLYASADIKVYPIEIRSTQQVDIPKPQETKDDRSWLSRNKWWVIGGLAVVAGAAAAGGGGGGSSDGSGNAGDGGEGPAGQSGSATVNW